MSLISKAIANLFNGVSQQPAPMRHDSQCELQENAYASIALGLMKRPPTKHLAKLRAALASTNAFVHIINRDTSNRFALIIHDGTAEVFRLSDGAAATISFPHGSTYLTSSSPRTDFAAVTVADYTFIVNRTITAALGTATTGGTLTGTVQTFSKLPSSPTTGQIYKINGDNTDSFTAYYVQWNGTVWVECQAPGEHYQFDASTMPHTLVHTGALTFTFDQATWDDRLVGDLTSVPAPSFIGYTLNDVFFYRNRLGLLSDENVILSRAGKTFNFWPETATAVLDTDPIDVSTTSERVSILYHAVTYDKALFLFSDQQQFQLTGGDILTPKTVKIDPVTAFESNNAARPVALGNDLYFAVKRGNYSSIREYYISVETFSNDAADITAHVPAYVPANLFQLQGSTAEDLVVAVSSDQPNVLYGYKFYWGENTKAQSCWSKLFVLDAADSILGCGFIENQLYLVISRADGVYLETVDFTPKITETGLPFLCHLDRKQTLTGTYNAGTGLTTWNLGFADSGNFSVVLGAGFANNVGNQLVISRPDSSTITAVGDYSGSSCIVGRNYTMKYRFSEIYLKDQKDVAILTGKLKLKNMSLTYQDSAYFKVLVTPRARSTYTYTFTNRTVGDSGFTLSNPGVLSGTFSFPIGSANLGTTIEIQNDTYMPCFIQGAEWAGEFTIKSQRR